MTLFVIYCIYLAGSVSGDLNLWDLWDWWLSKQTTKLKSTEIQLPETSTLPEI